MNRPVTAHYFAAKSEVPLDVVCARLQHAFDTEPFELNSHAHWEYGKASSDDLAFNITRCSDTETIETWIKGTPRGVNYQAIIWCPDSEKAKILARFRAEVGAALGATMEHFLSTRGADSTKVPDQRAQPLEEPTSGFSLPLTWIMVVGIAGVIILIVRSCSG